VYITATDIGLQQSASGAVKTQLKLSACYMAQCSRVIFSISWWRPCTGCGDKAVPKIAISHKQLTFISHLFCS